MRALVTGGTGFVGQHLVGRLLERGDHVRMLVRPGSVAKAQPLLARGAEVAEGDILDASSIAAAAQGCDMAFHVAAVVGAGLPLSTFYAGNVEGTTNVIAACERANVHKLVHVSTESVLVDFADHTGDEEMPYPARYKDGYSETKAAGERAVVAAHRDGRLVTTVVRPSWIWGPGDTSILPAFVRVARRGMFSWVGGSHKRTTTSYVHNVVDGLLLAADRPESAGEIFFINDDEEVTAREFLTRQLAVCGIERDWPSIPLGVAMFSATCFEHAYRLLGFTGQPALNRYGIQMLGCERYFPPAKARRLLGYAPRTSIATGVEALGAWIEEIGGVEGLLRLAE